MRMQTPSLIIFVYGALVAAGGIMGYIKTLNTSKPSVASLVAGVVSGAILLGAGWALQHGQRWGLFLAMLVTALLLVFFGYRFMGSKTFMPGGLMTILSLIVLLALLFTGRGR